MYGKRLIGFFISLIVFLSLYLVVNVITGIGDFPFKMIPGKCFRVDITNHAGIPIKQIEFTSHLDSDKYTNRSLNPNETCTLFFYQRGEGVFSLYIKLPSGKKMNSSEMYVEAGYFVHAIIEQDSIRIVY